MPANHVIAIYRPKKGKAAALLALVRSHHARLVALGYAAPGDALVLRSPKDGTLLEIFAWRSDAHVARAHKDPAIMRLWGAFAKVCDYGTPAGLAEAESMFPHFEMVAGTKRGQAARAGAKAKAANKKPRKPKR